MSMYPNGRSTSFQGFARITPFFQTPLSSFQNSLNKLQKNVCVFISCIMGERCSPAVSSPPRPICSSVDHHHSWKSLLITLKWAHLCVHTEQCTGDWNVTSYPGKHSVYLTITPHDVTIKLCQSRNRYRSRESADRVNTPGECWPRLKRINQE